MTNSEEILAVVPDGLQLHLGIYKVTIHNPLASSNCFEADVTVEKNDLVIFHDHARLINPPVYISEPTGQTVTEVDEITGQENTVPVFITKKDPLGALTSILLSTIQDLS
ncbi:hypothetical protein O4H49_13025 [Kiloniella laminariae]|uniref:Uncharacterized protein n=1 Tax=Kiloniella laminariae TaxID=454162 RepID=A0ABT4LKU2_9PROT|nr:hypothetical protein [Kiloniella laminariae]MCZ4281706.1 hypothetical protein [Kiloniella laminariae]